MTSIVREFNVVVAGHNRVVVLEEFKKNRVGRLSVCKATKTCLVKLVVVHTLVHKLAVFTAQDEIEVTFV
jgi:hypothetical protein